jgi:hypothetical protein
MELHRLAIALVALLLAATMVMAAGRIISGDGSNSVEAPTSAPRSQDAPVVRLGTPRADGSTPPPLLAQPTPRPDVTPRASDARESSSPESVVGSGE